MVEIGVVEISAIVVTCLLSVSIIIITIAVLRYLRHKRDALLHVPVGNVAQRPAWDKQQDPLSIDSHSYNAEQLGDTVIISNMDHNNNNENKNGSGQKQEPGMRGVARALYSFANSPDEHNGNDVDDSRVPSNQTDSLASKHLVHLISMTTPLASQPPNASPNPPTNSSINKYENMAAQQQRSQTNPDIIYELPPQSVNTLNSQIPTPHIINTSPHEQSPLLSVRVNDTMSSSNDADTTTNFYLVAVPSPTRNTDPTHHDRTDQADTNTSYESVEIQMHRNNNNNQKVYEFTHQQVNTMTEVPTPHIIDYAHIPLFQPKEQPVPTQHPPSQQQQQQQQQQLLPPPTQHQLGQPNHQPQAPKQQQQQDDAAVPYQSIHPGTDSTASSSSLVGGFLNPIKATFKTNTNQSTNSTFSVTAVYESIEAQQLHLEDRERKLYAVPTSANTLTNNIPKPQIVDTAHITAEWFHDDITRTHAEIVLGTSGLPHEIRYLGRSNQQGYALSYLIQDRICHVLIEPRMNGLWAVTGRGTMKWGTTFEEVVENIFMEIKRELPQVSILTPVASTTNTHSPPSTPTHLAHVVVEEDNDLVSDDEVV